MQTQHISDIYPNVISITRVRKDIDALTRLLEKYPEVAVLRGHTVLFKAVRSHFSKSKKEKIKEAVAFFKTVAKKYKAKKGELSATGWLIRERDRMRTKAYYDEHNR